MHRSHSHRRRGHPVPVTLELGGSGGRRRRHSPRPPNRSPGTTEAKRPGWRDARAPGRSKGSPDRTRTTHPHR
jgi:hypothetical protein